MRVDKLTGPIQNIQYHPDLVSRIEPDLPEKIQESDATLRTWQDPPGATHPPHDHSYAHRVLCVEGWIEFTVDSETYRLVEGDALDLPEGVTHSARTRASGPTAYWLIRPSP